ncbi:Protein of unknown function [Propionibacterium freudenreichii]|nr:Protein of unknown function [Propionibacterium freudenreichii]CEI47984.1 Protein of unknown function [Propionibacterium freudenreichii]
MAEYSDESSGGEEQSDENLDDCRFPRAIRAEEPKQIAPFNAEGDTPNCVD